MISVMAIITFIGIITVVIGGCAAVTAGLTVKEYIQSIGWIIGIAAGYWIAELLKLF